MWPHAPRHELSADGTFIVTAATLGRRPVFRGREQVLHDGVLTLAAEMGWRLQAWAVFSNHYHFVADCPLGGAATLRPLLRRLHAGSATVVNRADRTPGRQVWANYWDTAITNQGSYLARLAYVHLNAVEHGLVTRAALYPWCSATWFESTASSPFVQTVYSFKTDHVHVRDVECGA